jgi:hypothetical protein
MNKWSFKFDKTSTPHMGPMAQDFHAAFGLGTDDKGIDTGDGYGVALAAVQGVYRVAKMQQSRLDKLEQDNAKLRMDNVELGNRIERLERSAVLVRPESPAGSLGLLLAAGGIGLGVVVAGRRRRNRSED